MAASLSSGVTVSRYRVLEPLGRGGMGEVYKAWDPTLERAIALKILPPELVRNADRVRRFVQEAKSASSLNHPHIVTIHEVGEARLPVEGGEDANVQYIAMELIDGDTIRRKMNEGSDLRLLVGWLAQAADGVAKAHAAGIVHRDLKPENIMVSRDGFTKVLDFGLAKLVDRADPVVGADKTEVRGDTGEGQLVGTIGYMSPEQVLGRVVDHRSDIFSFGSILYEAATKRKPFAADSDVDVMHKIVHDKPEPVDRFNPSAPGELRRLIRRCLAKEPDSRYQSMKDLAIELRELHDDWDDLSISSDPRSSSESHERPTLIMPMPKGRSRRGWMLIAAVVLVALAGGLLAWRRFSRPAGPQFTFDRLKVTKLTSSGNVVLAAISPDGKYLAVQTREAGKFALTLKQIATGSNIQVVAPQAEQIGSVTFSPDSNFLFYNARENDHSEYSVVYAVPTLGGAPRKVLFDIDSAVTFSPDGKHLVGFRGVPQKREGDLVVANADGSGARVLAAMAGEERLDYVTPAWSPDGKGIAAVIYSTRGGIHAELAMFDPATGSHRRVGAQNWFNSGSQIVWAPDGSGIYLSASPMPNGPFVNQIWFVSWPAGVATRVYTDTNYYTNVSVTADGKSLVVVQNMTTGAVYDENGKALTPADQIVQSVAVAGDRIVYGAYANDTGNAWMLDDHGGHQQLTTAGHVAYLFGARDVRLVSYRSIRGDQWKPCILNIDTGVERVLDQETELSAVTLTPDGSAVFFAGGSHNMNMVPLNGGRPRTLVAYGAFAVVSPDGRKLAVSALEHEANGKMSPKLEILDSSTGAVLQKTDGFMERFLQWMPAGNAIAYFDFTTPRNIFVQPLAGGPPTQMTHFDAGDIFGFDFTKDGKLLIARGDVRQDAVMISDFR